MDYQLTPLGRQIGVFAREAVGVSYRLTAELITPVATYPVMMVTQLHTIRNFEKAVGDEVYILPLSSVGESFQVNSDDVSTVAQGAQLVKVRDEYMPVIALERIFQVPRPGGAGSSGNNIMVVVEADGSRVAVLVDGLLGQHQVVVKNLETNYRKVPNVSGATILGDGTVALILDTGALVRRARH